MEFPYIESDKNLRTFLNAMYDFEIPKKLNEAELVSLGYSSSYYQKIPTLLKFIGFLDDKNIPTVKWREFRDKEKSGFVMANALREGYASLFSRYKNAQEKDDEALRNLVSGQSSQSKATVGKIVKTFKTLCEYANFNGEAPLTELEPISESQKAVIYPIKKDIEEISLARKVNEMYTININIELTLPATNDSQIYDKLFESMKKHLLSKE
jgi:uncharacterized membrane protein YkvA (DUF1232 family)